MPDLQCTYLCPIRASSTDGAAIEEFAQYWRFLAEQGCEVLVVDGSPEPVFSRHAAAWTHCRHIAVDNKYTYLNGKVNGVMTGVNAASHDKIIIADDDIRYTASDLRRMTEDLEGYDVVKPQNYFGLVPWWSRIDSARMLINRAVVPEGDYPGTNGVRKSIFEKAGPYDGDVLFENEEMIRHFRNHDARFRYATDFFIRRMPPTLDKWLEQRPRQAYEDFAMKKKTTLFASLLPAHLLLGVFGKRKFLGLLALATSAVAVGLALRGRRNGAQKCIPARYALYAPLWVLERSINVHVALYWRFVKGGCPYTNVVIRKGTGDAWKVQSKKAA
ncbi:glycosyltransferase [Pontibacter korlensis]|uniref:Glycosyltransferase 2-like domain-containing protein n=1 Tax=Pontibacter korlensis TaxID=400092 RepID=A0A0E3ZC34_9BACT|nr:glycosyltransferase [Pontibacter korlensis]AKD02359.1 hypothetical protein PKOR_03465 [Pontibacter korlensis]